MGRVVHFEIHAEDPARAVDFYTKVFGWEATLWDGPVEYWLLTTGPDGEPGINGAIMQGSAKGDTETFHAFVCTVDVNDLQLTTNAVEEHGGRAATPRTTVPGVGYMRYFIDTEGNVFGAMQPDPDAKE